MKLGASRDLKTGLYSLLFKVGSMAIAFGLSILLARELGAEGLGFINLLDKVFTILVTVSLIGSSNYVVKHASYLFGERNFRELSKLLGRVLAQIGILSLVIAGLSIWVIPLVFDDIQIPLWIIHFYCILLVPRVYGQLIALFLRSFGSISLSNFLLELPKSYTRMIGIVIFLFDGNLTTQEALIGYCIGYSLFTILAIFLFLYKKGDVKLNRVDLLGKKLGLRRDQSTFWGINVMYILNSNLDTLYVGYFLSFTEVAQYNVAWRLANLLMIFLNLANSIMGPKISTMFKKGKIGDLEVYLGKSNYILSGIAIFYFLFFISFGDKVLTLWGDDFIDINRYVLILIVGQSINIATAGVGLSLSMANQENINFKIGLGGLLLTFVLYPIMLSQYGLLGAAITSSVIVSLMNIARVYFVRIKLGIRLFRWNL